MPDLSARPVADADDAARVLARSLLAAARFASLAVTDVANGGPAISRIAFGLCPVGQPVTLVSALSAHFQSLTRSPDCAIMVGEPGPKGDPLTHPRLMLQARAGLIDRGGADHSSLRRHWLTTHPKSALYIDFADFSFVRFAPTTAFLNAGFGKAFRLVPGDLLAPA